MKIHSFSKIPLTLPAAGIGAGKSLFFAFTLTALTYSGKAQITLTSENFPTAGTTITQISDTVTLDTASAPGANQTWNYATGYFNPAYQDTTIEQFDSLTNPRIPTAYRTGWISSDLVIYNTTDSAASYYKSSTNGFFLEGLYLGSALFAPHNKIAYTPACMEFPIPFSYDSSEVLNKYRYATYIGPASITSTVSETFTPDAWGNLTTPAGNMGSCLRVKLYQIETDSEFYGLVFINRNTDTTITYSWYNASFQGPVMNLSCGSGNIGRASYAGPTLTSVGNFNAPKANVKVYPNPSNTAVNPNINFAFENARSAEILSVYNSTGQLIRKQNIAGLSFISLQISQMAGGMYHYNIQSRSGELLTCGSFAVVK